MPNKQKNIIRQGYFKNYTLFAIKRKVLLEEPNKLNLNVGWINKQTNQILQEINLKVHDRQIPYVAIDIQYGDKITGESRIVLHDYETNDFYEESIKRQLNGKVDTSHFLDFLLAPGCKELTISTLLSDAELVIDDRFTKCAMTDIALDICMFNSNSFLRDMSIEDKRKFSHQKYEFAKKRGLKNFYHCNKKDDLYYSLAFFARESESKFNVNRYLILWEEFISEYYKGCTHVEKSVKEQLKMHRDFGQLPKDCYKKFNTKSKGAYLLLRTNKRRTRIYRQWICSIFGMEKYEKGKILIIPIEQFELYKPLFEHLDVSVFKVVKS